MKDCVSLDTAKKLKEAGWSQDLKVGDWYWAFLPRSKRWELFVLGNVVEAYERNQRRGAYNPAKHKEPCLHANEGRLCPYCKQEYALLRRAYDLGASREQAAAENAARAIVEAAESIHKQTISVQGQYAELKDVVIGSRGVVDAVRAAAAPFLKGK